MNTPIINTVTTDYRPPVKFVQSAVDQLSSLRSSLSITLAAQPKKNNILIAFLNINQYTYARTPTPNGSTWTALGSQTSAQAGLFVFWRIVGVDDASTYIFDVNQTAEYHSGIIYELSGADFNDPIDGHVITAHATSSTVTTTNITPTELSCYAISSVVAVNGTSISLTLQSVSSGWEAGASAIPLWESTFVSFRKRRTNDLETAINNVFIFNGATLGAVSCTVLLKPKKFLYIE